MKHFIKNFNNLIKKTIFKVQNKTNNKFTVSNFNKYLIVLISSLFIYLFYLLLPILYDKTWLQSNIENQLLKEFKINFSTSSNISYRILPSPHFLIKDSKIFKKEDEKITALSEIKNLKVFIHQTNFFDKEKMKLKEIKINNANFSLSKNDFKLLSNVSNRQFSNKKIKINNSNIFFKDNLNETIAIVKVDKAFLFFENKQLLNLFKLKAEVFNIPFIFNLKNKTDSSNNKEININARTLKLKIFNQSNKKNKSLISGKNIISFLNSTINTKYNIEENLIIFESEDSRLNKSKINYSGKFSINPFDLNLSIDLGNHKISKILEINAVLIELVKTELLFNNSISINTSIIAYSTAKDEFFQNAKIYFNIINGKINFDKTRLINKKIGSVELNDSSLFYENDKLTLNTNIIADIKSSKELFSFLQTNKKSRKKLRKILINLDYDFLSNQIKFNNIKIDNNDVSNELLRIVEGFNDNNLNNLNKSRRLLNKFFDAYEG
jgi:hypothetical protein